MAKIPFYADPVGLAGGLHVTIGDGLVVIPTGPVQGCVAVPLDMEPVGWVAYADAIGSIQLDVWKSTDAGYPATVLDTVTASAKVILSSAIKAAAANVNTWITTWSKGDVLRFNVDSVATIKRLDLTFLTRRT